MRLIPMSISCSPILDLICSVFFVLLLAVLASGCMTIPSIEKKYRAIERSDGVNAEEARLIAQKILLDSGRSDDFSLGSAKAIVGESFQPGIPKECKSFLESWVIIFDRKGKVAMNDVLVQYLIVLDKNSGVLKCKGDFIYSFWNLRWSFNQEGCAS